MKPKITTHNNNKNTKKKILSKKYSNNKIRQIYIM